MKPIAVLGCTLSIMPPSTGVATITSPPDTDVIIDNKNAYFGTMNISVSAATTTGATGGAGTGVLMGTSTSTTNHGKPAILMGDSVTITVTGTTTSSPPSPISWPLEVRIVESGQVSTSVD